MAVHQGLQNDDHVGVGHFGGGLHDHCLVELVDRTVDVVQPVHDRGGHHRPDALIDHPVLTVGHAGDLGQSGHGLFDEDVAGSTGQSACSGAGHDLHRQDAVSAEVEEGVVDADPLDT